MPKPTDIMDENNEDMDIPEQTPEQEKLARRAQSLFRAAFNAKNQLDLPNKWAMFDDYKHNLQNEPESEDHPGSVTNIIHPIIESQIADLVDKPYDVDSEGEEPSDDMYAEDAQHLMNFVLRKNQFSVKLNVSEHDRLELGTTAIKTYFNPDALDGRGLPTFEIISPANFFPDPKWSRSDLLQECEFIIHAVPRPLSYIRQKFPKWGKYIHREVSVPYDPEQTFQNAKSDEVEVVTSEKALLLECYLKDANGEIYCLHVANHILLEDSREVLKGKRLQRRNQFPFVAIPCYIQRGIGWGQGDVELLIPTQDIINDLDDQIRMNARMMGNPQIVVGMGAGKGFDYRKWTNAAGLRIPMRDVNAWKPVPPIPVSRDVVDRREKGFQEADLISGRPDVNRGERPGQVTAAAAIMALQQAGQKSVLHKAKMFKEGWSQVLGLLYDDMVEHWDEEMWIRVNGDKPDFKFINPASLKNIPRMIPNEVENGDPLISLKDVNGEIMTRECELDLKLNIGDGLPHDKAFVYQTLLEWSKMVVEGKPVIGWEEIRDYLKEQVGLPLQSNENFMRQLQAQQMQQRQPQPPAPNVIPMGGVPNVGQGR